MTSVDTGIRAAADINWQQDIGNQEEAIKETDSKRKTNKQIQKLENRRHAAGCQDMRLLRKACLLLHD